MQSGKDWKTKNDSEISLTAPNASKRHKHTLHRQYNNYYAHSHALVLIFLAFLREYKSPRRGRGVEKPSLQDFKRCYCDGTASFAKIVVLCVKYTWT